MIGMVAWWSSYYGDHQWVSVTIRFLHLAGLILGGGTALFADRQVWSARKGGPGERQAVIATLNRAHLHVVSWILIVGSTGLLMTAADTATFLPSRLYWSKIVLVGILVANGGLMVLIERNADRDGVSATWPKLVAISVTSAVLWLSTLFLGTLLTVAA
jgi:uncharacterized membrane-anchored protein